MASPRLTFKKVDLLCELPLHVLWGCGPYWLLKLLGLCQGIREWSTEHTNTSINTRIFLGLTACVFWALYRCFPPTFFLTCLGTDVHDRLLRYRDVNGLRGAPSVQREVFLLPCILSLSSVKVGYGLFAPSYWHGQPRAGHRMTNWPQLLHKSDSVLIVRAASPCLKGAGPVAEPPCCSVT